MKEKHKKYSKSILAFLLSLALVVTYMPTSLIAYALDDPEVTTEESTSAETPAPVVTVEEDTPSDEDTPAPVQPEDPVAGENSGENGGDTGTDIGEGSGEVQDEVVPEEEELTEPEKKPTVEYTEELTEVIVKVTVEEGAFDKDVSLVVKPLDKDNAEDKQAYEDAEKALAENEQTYDGILLYDIHFEDADGKEVEPDGTVSVEMKAKKKALRQIPAGNINEQSVKVTHIGQDKTEVVADTDKKSDVEGTVDITVGKKNVEALDIAFEVESFSTFALTWDENKSATIHWGYLDDGGTFHELAEEASLDTDASSISMDVTMTGYVYGTTWYLTEEASSSNPVRSGEGVESVLHKKADGKWYYTIRTPHDDGTVTTEDFEVADQSHLYAVYSPKGQGNPSGADTVNGPKTYKNVGPNEDGTYEVELDIVGASKSETHQTGANVLLVLDTTFSMATSDMDGADNRFEAARSAALTLIDTLNPSVNDIDFALVEFNNLSGTSVKQFNGSYWTDDYTAFRSYIANDTNHASGATGTNWEAGLTSAITALSNSGRDSDATYVIFLTDGEPNRYISDEGWRDWWGVWHNAGEERSGNADTSRSEAQDEANLIVSGRTTGSNQFAGSALYGVFCGSSSGSNQLSTLVTAAGGVSTIKATSKSEIENAFRSIATTIVENIGSSNVSTNDGITALSGVSAHVSGAAGAFRYYIAYEATKKDDGSYTYVNDDGDTVTITDASKIGSFEDAEGNTKYYYDRKVWDEAPGAAYNQDTGVTWDLSDVGTLKGGRIYTVAFDVWPSQDAYDLIADLDNKVTTLGEQTDDVNEQLFVTVDGTVYEYNKTTQTWTGGLTTAQLQQRINSATTVSYNLKTNTHLDTSYTYQNQNYTDSIAFVQGAMPLVSYEMDVFKLWDDSINPRNRTDQVDFYLLVSGKYYQNDGSFADTKDNAYILTTKEDDWTDSVQIAPGFATLNDDGTLDVKETGHKYALEEIPSTDPEYEGYSQEFTTQTVRPMVINGTLTNLVLVDADNPKPAGATTYTIGDETYYVSGTSTSSLTGTNHKTAELDITKAIDATESDKTADQLNSETFTYEVTFNVPEGGDVSGINYWIYEQNDSGWTLPEYDSDGLGKDYAPYGHTDGAKYSGTKSSTSASGQTVTATVTIKRGQVVRFTNLPTGTTYTIVETKANGQDLTDQGYVVDSVKSTNGTAGAETIANDKITGEIEAHNTRYYNQFTNKLVAVDAELKVTKAMDYNWTDGDNSYEFTLTAVDGAPLPYKNASEGNKVTVSSSAALTKSFGLIRFTQAGTYTYTITETDGENPAIVYGGPATVTVTVNNDLEVTNITATGTEVTAAFTAAAGNNDASGNITITNKRAITSLEGTKTWNDENNANSTRPTSITIHLVGKADGETVDLTALGLEEADLTQTVVAGTDGTWKYSFSNLPKYVVAEDGTRTAISYSVQEDTVENYATVYPAPSYNETANKWTADVINTNVTINTNVDTFFKKTVTTPNPVSAATFNFSLTEVDAQGEALDGGTTATGSVDYAVNESGSKTIDFGKITFTEEGTYYYKITETGKPSGWTVTPESGETIVTVVVAMNDSNQLTATVTGSELQNAYGVEPTTASFPVKKELSVPEGLTGPATWSYTIGVTANNGAPVAETMEATVDQDNTSVTFGPITYTESGIYFYKVTESGTVAGVTDDAAATTGKTVMVTVIDNGDGTLTATASSTTANPLTFTNTYSVDPTTISFPVKKILSVPEGLEGPATWSYTITVAANDGAPAPSTTSGTVTDEADTATFGPITYTAPGTYTYKVTETGTVAGVTNDAAAESGKTVTVEVVDNGDGTLTATADSTAAEPLTFTNTYGATPVTASFPVKKVLSVPEGLTGPETWSYTIGVTANNGAPEADTMTGTVNQGKQSVTFGDFTYTAPGTYTYTVTEEGTVAGVTNDSAASSGKTVTVTVEDDGTGKLTAAVSPAAGITFTNTYAASGSVDLVALKKATGFELQDGQFSFELKDKDGTVLQTKQNDAEGNVAFDTINYTAAGTYTYTINEVVIENDDIADDVHTCDVTVTVVDNGNGTLTATADYSSNTFTNIHNENLKDVVSAGNTTISVDGEIVEAGDTLTYTITYANNTSGAATVTVTDAIPANTTYVDGSASNGGVYADGVITWTIENVAAGETGTVTFQVTVNESSRGKTLENTAYVDDGENQSNTNAVTTSVPVKDVVDASGSSIDNESVQVGDTLTYKVTFTLTEEATSVVVTDAVPANTTLVDGSISNNGSVSDGTITWDLGALAAGTYTVSFKVTVDESAVTVDDITNTASISVNNHADVKTNTTTNTTEVGNLTVSKTVTVPAGFTIDTNKAFTFTVTLTDKNDEPLTGSYAYSGSYTGTLTNGGTFTLKHGESITIAKLPAGAKYTITETAEDGYTAAQPVITGEIANENVVTAAFTNAYGVEPATVSFPVKKVLNVPEGLEGPETWSYTINVSANNGAPAPSPAVGTVTNSDDTTTFGPISYTKPGVYYYTVTESGSVAGVTNDAAASTGKTVMVTVVDNGDGTLSATASSTDASPLTFTNTYGATPATVSFPVKKILSVPEGLEGPATWSYTINVAANDGAPAPSTTSGTVTDKADTATFGPITYTAPGEYTYTVTETGTVAGVTNDTTTEKTVTVNVVDNGDGTLTATADSTDDEPLTFTNTYSVDPTTAEFPVTKELVVPEGLEGPEEWEYTISVTANDGAPAADTMTGTIDQDNTSVTFGDFTYNAPGTYTYTVTETGTVAGVTNDAAAESGKTVTVEVVDNGDGTLSATVAPAAGIKFTNTYGVEPTTAAPEATKTLTGRALNADEFKFQLKKGEDVLQNKTNTADGTVAFDAIKYTEPGTYNYTISEIKENLGGVTYDETVHNVVVTVVDNQNGTLSATIKYDDADEAPEFRNTYAATGSVTFEGTKTIEGREMTADDIFEFTITEGEKSWTVRNDGTGKINYPTISYTLDEVGTHEYTVTETSTGGDGITVDTRSYTVTVNVEDNGDGTLKVTPSGNYTTLDFVNTYKAEGSVTFQGEKSIDSRDFNANEVFTFEITEGEGATAKTWTATSDTTGTITYPTITYSIDENSDADLGTHTYTVRETSTDGNGITVDTNSYTVTVEVTDNGDGTLSAVPSSNARALNFVNTYEADGAITFAGTKTLNGRDLTDDDRFTFEVTEDGTTNKWTATNDATGKINYPTITYHHDAETSDLGTHTYTVRETSTNGNGITVDTRTYTVSIEVTDGGYGALVITPSGADKDQLNFINEYAAKGTVTFKGTKSVEGRAMTSSDAFTFQIKEGDTVVGTATQDANGNIVFPTIEYNHSSAASDLGRHTYTVTETSADGNGITVDTKSYTVTVNVRDNGDGTLNVVPSSNYESLDFINTYEAEGEVTFTGTKTIRGRQLAATDVFTFTVTDGTNTWEATSDASGAISYPTITYKIDAEHPTEDLGEHTYTVRETSTSGNGITVDTNTYTVTVNVTDNGNGTLKVEASDNAESLNFVNTYEATGQVTFSGEKKIEGRAMTEDDVFTFEITEGEGENAKTWTATSDGTGQITYPTITYKIDQDHPTEDLGEHTYTVKETTEDGDGITVDTNTYTVTVTVSDNGNGTLNVVPSDNYDELDFVNEYEATGTLDFSGLKTLNRGDLADQEFSFELVQVEKKFIFFEEEEQLQTTSAGGSEEGVTVEGKDSSAEFNFETITFTKNKDKDECGEYTYIIREIIPDDARNADGVKYEDATDEQKAAGGFVKGNYEYDTHAQTITVTVTDNGDGTLSVVKSPAAEDYDAEFVNTKKYTELVITKNLNAYVKHENADDVTIAFQVVDTETGGEQFKAAAGLTYTSEEVLSGGEKTVTIYKVPTDMDLTISEIYTSNFEVDKSPQKVTSAEMNEDGIYEIKFQNTYDNIIYNTGVINRYTQNDDGGYNPPGGDER